MYSGYGYRHKDYSILIRLILIQIIPIQNTQHSIYNPYKSELGKTKKAEKQKKKELKKN